MYFCVLSSSLDVIADVLPHCDFASDTKLMVSRTAFTYILYAQSWKCTHTTDGDKLRCLIALENVLVLTFCFFLLLTTIMATIGPINANITPFSLGNQHLKQIYDMKLS